MIPLVALVDPTLVGSVVNNISNLALASPHYKKIHIFVGAFELTSTYFYTNNNIKFIIKILMLHLILSLV